MSDQPLPSEGQVDVTESLIEWLRERQAKGIATYGRSLETFNGRDVTRDLREELLDALQYSHQWTLERQALLNQRDAALRGMYLLQVALRTAELQIDAMLHNTKEMP